MRRLIPAASLGIALIALALIAPSAIAQTTPPGYSGGGMVANLPTTDGAPVPASLGRALAHTDLLAAQRWLLGWAAPVQPVASRTALKTRRANVVRRPPIWVP